MNPDEQAETRRHRRAIERAYATLSDDLRADVDAAAAQDADEAGFTLGSTGREVVLRSRLHEHMARGFAREVAVAARELAADGEAGGSCVWTSPGFRADPNPPWAREWADASRKLRMAQVEAARLRAAARTWVPAVKPTPRLEGPPPGAIPSSGETGGW